MSYLYTDIQQILYSKCIFLIRKKYSKSKGEIMERVFGEEVRNHHTRPSTTAHLLFNQYHSGVKFLCSNMKLSLYHMRQKTPGPASSLEVVIKELPLGVASLVANLAIQIFGNWNQSPHNLLNILRTWCTYCESSKRQTKQSLGC